MLSENWSKKNWNEFSGFCDLKIVQNGFLSIDLIMKQNLLMMARKLRVQFYYQTVLANDYISPKTETNG